eukprot:1425719-Pyramimonas_sp.AAC.2
MLWNSALYTNDPIKAPPRLSLVHSACPYCQPPCVVTPCIVTPLVTALRGDKGDTVAGLGGSGNTGGLTTRAGFDNTEGENTGDDNTGGDNTGGDNTGGDNTGGDNSGMQPTCASPPLLRRGRAGGPRRAQRGRLAGARVPRGREVPRAVGSDGSDGRGATNDVQPCGPHARHAGDPALGTPEGHV